MYQGVGRGGERRRRGKRRDNKEITIKFTPPLRFLLVMIILVFPYLILPLRAV